MADSFNYANEIWNIADYLRDIIKRSEYNRVILPFALLRRLECALEPTREAVINALEENAEDKKDPEGNVVVQGWGRESDNYCMASKKAFYNTTRYRLNTLGATDTLLALMDYINGFSPNAREILLKFKMEETCKILEEHGMLYEVCRRFAAFDLSPENVSDREMSDIYEHLIEKFGDEIAEDAEDFMTPKDVVRLATGMVFANDDELMNSDTGIVRTLYDCCSGTAGFISDAMDLLDEWHKDKKMVAPAVIVPYGQECEQESWAMGKANILLRNISGEGVDMADAIKDLSAHMAYGDTLSDDKFEGTTFNYILTNPPYGKKWEKQKDAVTDEARLGFNGRFGAGLPSISDGSMLFLQHVVSKLAPVEEGGGKAGIVLSASPLFNGDAGSGPSNIRRWLFENDFIDCIVKLPQDIFFRTGINTYLWILTNRKEDWRKGKVQLIDASDLTTPLRKSKGKKRKNISDEGREWIIKTYIDGHDHGNSVLVPWQDFCFRHVTTQCPLRMKIQINKDKYDEFKAVPAIEKLSEDNLRILMQGLEVYTASDFADDSEPPMLPYDFADTFAKDIKSHMDKVKSATPAQISVAIIKVFGVKSPDFDIVYDKKGNMLTDPDLKDYEDIPLGMDFDEYMNKEVLPYRPDAFIDESVRDSGPLQDGEVGVVGTNISFNKYFYHYEEPRRPEEIAAELLELESGLESFMEGFLK